MPKRHSRSRAMTPDLATQLVEQTTAVLPLIPDAALLRLASRLLSELERRGLLHDGGDGLADYRLPEWLSLGRGHARV